MLGNTMSVTTKDTKPSTKPKSKKPTNTKPNTPTSLPLTAKQKLFAEKYVEPGSTFLNGAASARAAYPNQKDVTHRTTAVENLAKPNILSYIEQLNAENGIGVVDRSRILATTLEGKTTHDTETEYYNAEGESTGNECPAERRMRRGRRRHDRGDTKACDHRRHTNGVAI